MEAPTVRATGAARPSVATMNVCRAIKAVESSGITTTAKAAAAAEAKAPAWRAPGPRLTTDANNGSADGASSTTFGRMGNNSGPEASTKTKISGFLPAASSRGSKLERDIPAA